MGGSDQPEDYLVERVREALATDPRVGELSLEVRVEGEEVILTGAVPTEERRSAVGAVAAGVAQGRTIRNDTVVEDLAPPGDVEEVP